MATFLPFHCGGSLVLRGLGLAVEQPRPQVTDQLVEVFSVIVENVELRVPAAAVAVDELPDAHQAHPGAVEDVSEDAVDVVGV